MTEKRKYHPDEFGGQEPSRRLNTGADRSTRLTHEEEKDLARQIATAEEARLWLLEVANTFGKQSQEYSSAFMEVEPIVKQGEEAKYRFVRANEGLVVSWVIKYLNKGVHIDELYQEGMVGLLTAIQKFDPDRDNRFSTFAVWHIREKIMSALTAHGHVIRVSDETAWQLRKVSTVIMNFQQDHSRKPTPEELEKLTGIPEATLMKLAGFAETHVLSIDQPTDDGRNEIGDLLSNPHDVSVEAQVLRVIELEGMYQLLSAMEEQWGKPGLRRSTALRLWYGLAPYDQSYKFKAIGEKLGVSSQRARILVIEGREWLRSYAATLKDGGDRVQSSPVVEPPSQVLRKVRVPRRGTSLSREEAMRLRAERKERRRQERVLANLPNERVDIWYDKAELSAEGLANNRLLKETVEEILKDFLMRMQKSPSELEEDVSMVRFMRMRFGLAPYDRSYTLDEIAAEENLIRKHNFQREYDFVVYKRSEKSYLEKIKKKLKRLGIHQR